METRKNKHVNLITSEEKVVTWLDKMEQIEQIPPILLTSQEIKIISVQKESNPTASQITATTEIENQDEVIPEGLIGWDIIIKVETIDDNMSKTGDDTESSTSNTITKKCDVKIKKMTMKNKCDMKVKRMTMARKCVVKKSYVIRTRIPFTQEEDTQIVQYIRRKNRHSDSQQGRLGGNIFWEMMVQENVCPGRSWQSLKGRWHKTLKSKVGDLSLDETNTDYESSEEIKPTTNCDVQIKSMPFTREEDTKMVQYIRKKNVGGHLGGNIFWEIMEQENVCPGRSWQSLKSRWLKTLKSKVDDFPLDETTADDEEMEPPTLEKCSLVRCRLPNYYTKEEDDAILTYLKKNNFNRVGGVLIWKNMANMKILKRTWQSMKERYMKVLSRPKRVQIQSPLLPISEYEKIRLTNIKEREEKFKQLEIGEAKTRLSDALTPTQNSRGLSTEKRGKEILPPRKSLRQQNIDADMIQCQHS